MKILIAYATTEGHTRKVAEALKDGAQAAGNQVTLHDLSQPFPGMTVDDFDSVIMAGSVHNGIHQETLELFAFANRATLADKPTLFVSVSMAAAFDDTKADATRYIDEFCERSQWRPGNHVVVAGATKHEVLGWYEQSSLSGGDLAAHVDKEMSEDGVFTDWDQLQASLAVFLETARQP